MFKKGYVLGYGLRYGLGYRLGAGIGHGLEYELGYGLGYRLGYELGLGLWYELGRGLWSGLRSGLGYGFGYGLGRGFGYGFVGAYLHRKLNAICLTRYTVVLNTVPLLFAQMVSIVCIWFRKFKIFWKRIDRAAKRPGSETTGVKYFAAKRPGSETTGQRNDRLPLRSYIGINLHHTH